MADTPSYNQREIADTIWRKIKGKTLPDSYSDLEAENIVARYWHRAMESEQGVDLHSDKTR